VTQELELVYWKDVKDSDDPEDLEGFLDKFPAGIYADLARRRLRKLAGDPTNTVNALPVSALLDPEATRMRDPSVPSIPPTYPLGTADPRAASPDLQPAQWIDEEYTKTLVEAPAIPPTVPAAAAAAPSAPTSPLMAAGEAALAAASAGGFRRDPSTTPLSPPPPVPAPALAPAPVAAAPATPAASTEPAAARPPVAVPLKSPTRAVDDDESTAPPVRRRKVPVAAVAGIAVLAIAGLVTMVVGRTSTVSPEASVAAATASIAPTAPGPAPVQATAAPAPVTTAATPGDVTPVPPPANPLAARPVAAQSPAAPAAAQAKKPPPPKAGRPVAAAPQPVEPARPFTSAAAPAPRAEPEPPRPVPPPSIASANAAAMNAVDECKDKMFLSREICLKDNCGKAGARSHPMCVRYREEVRLREESKQLPQNR
jgi:serine/threonine-protein kinase